MSQVIVQLTVPLLLVFIGLLAGRFMEQAHLRRLTRRENALARMLVTDLRSMPGATTGTGPPPKLVVGEAVIATDYFKSFVAGLRGILGGEIGTYLTLVERARREAKLRLLERAREDGYNAVANVRLAMADVGGNTQRKGMPLVAVMAFGTAYRIAEAEA